MASRVLSRKRQDKQHDFQEAAKARDTEDRRRMRSRFKTLSERKEAGDPLSSEDLTQLAQLRNDLVDLTVCPCPT